MIKTNLLTLVTHETGTPLNGIIGCAELLLERSSLSSRDRELISMIADSGNQLHQFMRKALLLCKLKAGLEVSVYREQLRKSLQQIINSFKKDASRKGVTFVTELAEDIVLNVDWTLVVEAMRLLVDNAVKFSPEGGVVKISSLKDGNYCLINIADQGEGVAPGEQDNIFTEFAIRDVSHHCQGQGISLAIVRHVVTCHNGTVTVSGERGKGTVFTVKIPLAEDQ
jgi:signal transduction histidine kinase